MKEKVTIVAKDLSTALLKASELYNIPLEHIEYRIRKDRKSGIFGIIEQRDIEIEVILASSKKKSMKKMKQAIEEELNPFTDLSIADKEITLAIVKEVINKIIYFFCPECVIDCSIEGNAILVKIPYVQELDIVLERELEVIKAIQYIVYKVVTQQVRCFFSLQIMIGEHIVSEETLLVNMVNKLIEKVKATQKTQRTYPLNASQREVVRSIVQQETLVSIKELKDGVSLQPVVLVYNGE